MINIEKIYNKYWILKHDVSGVNVSGNHHKTKKSAKAEADEFSAILSPTQWAKENPFEGVDEDTKAELIAVKRKYKQ